MCIYPIIYLNWLSTNFKIFFIMFKTYVRSYIAKNWLVSYTLDSKSVPFCTLKKINLHTARAQQAREMKREIESFERRARRKNGKTILFRDRRKLLNFSGTLGSGDRIVAGNFIKKTRDDVTHMFKCTRCVNVACFWLRPLALSNSLFFVPLSQLPIPFANYTWTLLRKKGWI